MVDANGRSPMGTATVLLAGTSCSRNGMLARLLPPERARGGEIARPA